MAPRASHPIVRQWQRIIRQVRSEYSPATLRWLLRCGLVTGQKSKTSGFILPTVTLMLLMMSLVVGVLVFRSFNRTAQVIGQKQQRVLYNAATPAIERGKAKIEYVFNSAGLPALPSDEALVTELANDATYTLGDEQRIDVNRDNALDNAWVYSVDGDGDGTKETVVAYSLLTYASRVVDLNSPATTTTTDDTTLDFTSVDANNTDARKAKYLIVRNGPINLTGSSTKAGCTNVNLSPLAGWQPVSGSQYRKAIQVHAVVINPNTGVAATLEMQQDKVGNLGNKWGAWFRYDLASNAGGTFNWNGAMYTHGNFFLTPDSSANTTRLYQISSASSCIYDANASEITMKGTGDNDPSPNFQGQFVVGNLAENKTTVDGTFTIDPYVVSGTPTTVDMSRANDSVKGAATGNASDSSRNTGVEPSDIALDPIMVLTEDKNQYANGTDTTASLVFATGQTGVRVSPESDWQRVTTGGTYQRIGNSSAERPYVDDLYRADNRWGPSARYNQDYGLSGSNLAGSVISGNDALTSNGPASLVGAETDFGLDGYWERRARRIGVRVVVGERLELGNAFGFTGDGKTTRIPSEISDPQVEDDPLFPGDLGLLDPLLPETTRDPAVGTGMDEANADLTYNIGDSDKTDKRSHELRQWRSLRDNLAAVQATAVYHYKSDNGTDASGQYPVACMATTVHPGTQETEQRSRTFLYIDADKNLATTTDRYLSTDFFTGQGTNGLEFTVPFTGATNPEAKFQEQYDLLESPLRRSLTNLAYFAGDWKSSTDNGAYPPQQDLSTATSKRMRPDPTMTMWGNFSNLRRIIESGTAYNNLSIADQTTLHTATCTIGALAYQAKLAYDVYAAQLNNLDALKNDSNYQNLAVRFEQLANGVAGNGQNQAANLMSTSTWTGGATNCPKSGNPGGFGQNSTEISVEACVTIDGWANGTDGTRTGAGKLINPATGVGYFDNSPSNTLYGTTDAARAAMVTKFIQDYGPQFYASFTVDQWKAADIPGINDIDAIVNIINNLTANTTNIYSILRDRTWGFSPGLVDVFQNFNIGTPTLSSTYYGWDSSTGYLTTPSSISSMTAATAYKTGCNPSLFSGLVNAANDQAQLSFIGFALSACKNINTDVTTQPIRFPPLYYLFPLASHYHTGGIVNSVKTAAQTAGIKEATQYYNNGGVATPFNTYVDVVNPSGPGFNNTASVIYRPVEDGLGSCTTAGCTSWVSNQDGVAAPSPTGTNPDDLRKFSIYLGMTPIEAVANAKLPVTTTATGRANIILFDTDKDGVTAETPWYPAFLDTAFFDGRQQMLVRALSMDVDLMRRTNITNTNCTLVAPTSDTTDTNGNCWLPLPTIDRASDKATRTGAVIYAAREDAIREDAISRPAANTWANCNTLTKMVSTNASTCRTNLFAGSAYGQDPPLNTNTGLSPKAVDFVPDPDRRPHGFRLRNGSDLRRMSGGSAFTNDNSRGLSFVTPNSLYVQGNFNLHTQNEFNTALDATWSNFYTRTNVNSNFATPANDNWRVTELAADAVTVLSESFCAGFIDRGIMKLQVDCDADGAKDDNHSFRAISGPSYTSTNASNVNGSNQINTSNRWWRENINGINSPVDFTTGATAWPILISRNGFPVYNHDNATTVAKQQYGVKNAAVQDFAPFRDSDLSNGINSNPVAAEQPRDYINIGTSTTLNAVVISGINPARAYQPDGAMPIFLRAIENWGTNTLSFAGSLIQLNFSSYATGLQDQDAWEPNDAPSTDDNLNAFYEPPVRAWGYDVALQYAPAGPVAQRFRTSSNIRSEFYRELAIDDPYINNLRCAKYDSDNDGDIDVNDQRIDTRLTATECP